MLNYDLVTGTAAYRILKRRDVGAFLEMAARFRGELGKTAVSSDALLNTFEELTRDERKGTIFLIEKGESFIGYCVIVNLWNAELGGNVLCMEELFVDPQWRRRGIAQDFITLLGKIAPLDSVAIRLEVDPSNKKAAALCRKLGFAESKQKILSKGIQRERPADALHHQR